MLLFFRLEKTKTVKNAFKNGLIFGTGYFLGCQHWIIFPFLIYEQHFVLAPFVVIIFPLLMSIFYIISSILIFLTNFIISKFIFLRMSIISLILFLSELMRSFIFGGLPLSLTAHIWSFEYKFISIASYIGVFGLSFLTIYWLVMIFNFKKNKSIFFILVFIFPLILFFLPTSGHNDLNYSEKYLIRVVQPNIDQKEKWNRNLYQNHFNKLLSLTKEKLPDEKIIVVWPEVALTMFLNEEKELLEYLKKVLPQNIILVTGSLRREFNDSGYKIFNSLFVLSNGELKYYDKIKLVPFGEFIPFKNILNLLKLTPGSTDFSSGLKENRIKLNYDNNEIFIEPSICFESIFQTFSYSKTNLFVNITNDAWFGKTTGPTQHLAATVFRSIEKGLPIVRSANSGISAIINKNGQIIKSKKLNSSGYLESRINLGNNKTFFMKSGNFSLIVMILIIVSLGTLVDFILKYRKKD